jgi:hypothetical protein
MDTFEDLPIEFNWKIFLYHPTPPDENAPEFLVGFSFEKVSRMAQSWGMSIFFH